MVVKPRTSLNRDHVALLAAEHGLPPIASCSTRFGDKYCANALRMRLMVQLLGEIA